MNDASSMTTNRPCQTSVSSQHRPSGLVRLGQLSVLAVGLVLIAGCGGGRMTAGEFCSKMGVAFCDKMISCQLVTQAQRTVCLDAFQVGCCEEANQCGEEAPSDEDEEAAKAIITACSNALATHDCALLAQAEPQLPLACGGTAASTPAPLSVESTSGRAPMTPAPLVNAGQEKIRRAAVLMRQSRRTLVRPVGKLPAQRL
jgi:hypothetical protein